MDSVIRVLTCRYHLADLIKLSANNILAVSVPGDIDAFEIGHNYSCIITCPSMNYAQKLKDKALRYYDETGNKIPIIVVGNFSRPKNEEGYIEVFGEYPYRVVNNSDPTFTFQLLLTHIRSYHRQKIEGRQLLEKQIEEMKNDGMRKIDMVHNAYLEGKEIRYEEIEEFGGLRLFEYVKQIILNSEEQKKGVIEEFEKKERKYKKKISGHKEQMILKERHLRREFDKLANKERQLVIGFDEQLAEREKQLATEYDQRLVERERQLVIEFDKKLVERQLTIEHKFVEIKEHPVDQVQKLNNMYGIDFTPYADALINERIGFQIKKINIEIQNASPLSRIVVCNFNSVLGVNDTLDIKALNEYYSLHKYIVTFPTDKIIILELMPQQF